MFNLRLCALPIASLFMSAGCVSSEISVSAAACTQQSFPEFLQRFSSDLEFQKQAIEYPLTKMRIVDAEPEPKPQTQLFESKEIEFPVIPDKRRREAEGLLLDLNEVEQNHAKAELHKPDTDYQVTYLFEKEGCWKLHEIQDWSL